MGSTIRMALLYASPTEGKLLEIMPNAMHASRLRKTLSELSVTYTICLVSSIFTRELDDCCTEDIDTPVIGCLHF